MRNVIAPVNNIQLLTAAAEALSTRAPGTPGIGLIWGATGYGKTTATAWLCNKINAVYVRAWPTWRPTSMLSALMEELGMKPLGNIAAMEKAIVQTLALNSRPVFIDEADYLADRPILLEELRTLHDVSSSPLILIGMKNFQQRMMHREQLHGRISQWVEFQPADARDARTLADEVCEVKVTDDLLAKLHKAANGSMRRLVVGLSRIEQFAKKKGLAKVSEADWGERAFVLSDAPRARGDH